MNRVEFNFDRSRGIASARGQIWPIAIDRPTRPYNIASTTMQQVIVRNVFEVIFQLSVGPPTDRCSTAGIWKAPSLNRNSEIQDGSAKPDVPISQLPGKIAMKI
jgi:hypothetical protein